MSMKKVEGAHERKITIMVAYARDGVIGKDGKTPWSIKADLKRFKELTSGHPIIMGRKTHESIGIALPKRTNIVVTRNPTYTSPSGAIVVHSMEEALKKAQQSEGAEEIFVIGGGEIYALALPFADLVDATEVHAYIEGDAHFPPLDPALWKASRPIECKIRPEDTYNYHRMTFERRA